VDAAARRDRETVLVLKALWLILVEEVCG